MPTIERTARATRTCPRCLKAVPRFPWVTAAAPAVAIAAAPGAAAGAVEEKTEFDVVLAAVGDKKIQVIKEVRAITGLGLKDAKDLVEGAPKPIKEGVKKEEADEIKQKIEAAGGTAEVK